MQRKEENRRKKFKKCIKGNNQGKSSSEKIIFDQWSYDKWRTIINRKVRETMIKMFKDEISKAWYILWSVNYCGYSNRIIHHNTSYIFIQNINYVVLNELRLIVLT